MKLNSIKKLGRVVALSAVFAAAAMPALAQQGGAPAHSPQYTALAREVGGVSDIGNQISMTQHTAAVTGQPVDADAIKELRADLKQAADQVGPKIILTSGLSGPEVQSLIDQFKQGAGSLPDYLAKVNGKAKLVSVCQDYLVTPDGVYDKAHAVDVANCVASKQVSDPDTSVAQPLPTQPAPAQPVQTQPVRVPPAASAPQATDTAPAASGLPFGLTPVELGGGAAGVVVLGAGAALLMRRKKKTPEAPQQEPAAAAPPPPDTPPPAPPKDNTKIEVFKKPLQVTPASPPPQTDDTGPAKIARKFEI